MEDIEKDISEQAKKNLKLYTEISVNFGDGSGDGKAHCDLKQIYEWAKALINQACNQARIDELESLSKQFHYDNPRQRAFVSAINYRIKELKELNNEL